MKLVVFDLDGTLIDSATDIAVSVNELRARLGLTPLTLPTIESFVGNGIRALISRSTPEREETDLDAVIETYRAIYRERLLDHTRPYPGVEQAIHSLQDQGLELAVLTNKPLRESETILDGLELSKHFVALYGGDSFVRKKPDPMGLQHLMEERRISPEASLFVGDSNVDLETARNASVNCCLVTYGIGPAPEPPLEPDFTIDDMRELPGVVGSLS